MEQPNAQIGNGGREVIESFAAQLELVAAHFTEASESNDIERLEELHQLIIENRNADRQQRSNNHALVEPSKRFARCVQQWVRGSMTAQMKLPQARLEVLQAIQRKQRQVAYELRLLRMFDLPDNAIAAQQRSVYSYVFFSLVSTLLYCYNVWDGFQNNNFERVKEEGRDFIRYLEIITFVYAIRIHRENAKPYLRYSRWLFGMSSFLLMLQFPDRRDAIIIIQWLMLYLAGEGRTSLILSYPTMAVLGMFGFVPSSREEFQAWESFSLIFGKQFLACSLLVGNAENEWTPGRFMEAVLAASANPLVGIDRLGFLWKAEILDWISYIHLRRNERLKWRECEAFQEALVAMNPGVALELLNEGVLGVKNSLNCTDVPIPMRGFFEMMIRQRLSNHVQYIKLSFWTSMQLIGTGFPLAVLGLYTLYTFRFELEIEVE